MNRTIALLTACVLPALACRGKEPSGFIAFQLSAQPAGRAAAPDSAPRMVALGKDTLFLHRVRIVLAELAIAPSLANECEEEEGEDNPPCVEFDEHPVVIDLPLDRPVVPRSTKPAPATSYNLFQAIIHRPTPEADTALLQANPDFHGKSILAEGIWSRGGRRVPFSFASDFAEQEEISLEPALVVQRGDSLLVTLRVDVASWFKSEDGRTLVDPRTAGPGGPNEHLLRDHIRTSIRAFRDQNRDGQDDDSAH
jgi:hypothetical protein